MTSADLDRLTAPPPDARIVFGDDPLQFGELRLPDGPGPHPVAIVIHGGCWRAQYDMTHIGTIAEALAAEGIATWVLEYRRVGNPGGGWPGTFQDIADGADHLSELADDFPLDLDRVIAIGHSAGGHLALWLAARAHIAADEPLYDPDPIAVGAVLALAPAPDLAFLHEQEVCGHVIDGLMGGSPEQYPARYRAGSPGEHVPLGVPQRLVIGRYDDAWAPVGRRYFEVAESSGDDVRIIDANESGHFDMIDPATSTWPLIRDSARELLNPR
jgi:acetyl esterase/lipase